MNRRRCQKFLTVDSDVIVPIGSSLLMMESNRMSQLVYNYTVLKLWSYSNEYITNIEVFPEWHLLNPINFKKSW